MAIAIILKIQNKFLDAEHERLTKLYKKKSGLLHDLLTGRVPVRVEEGAVANVG